MMQLAAGVGIASPELPCRHHPRSSDHLLNQVVLAGLLLARQLVHDAALGVEIARLATRMGHLASRVALSGALLDRTLGSVTRLVAAYAPALRLVELLYHGSALSLASAPDPVSLPGFMLDMNRFFQALVGRLLLDNLEGYDVSVEHPLQDIMRYVPGRNPRGRRPPQPRPDFAVMRRRAVVALLDAKYRDLWEHDLPRDMLYQLATYAMSQASGIPAAMLYPTTTSGADDEVIEIRRPVDGVPVGLVAMRPVPLGELAAIVGDASQRASARHIARRLVFGSREPGAEESAVLRRPAPPAHAPGATA